jgi:hypothetical protein
MGVFDIVMEKPAEVSRRGECIWYSHGKTCLSQLKRCVLDIALYQTHSALRLTSAGFFMTISNTPIASTDFSRFFHDYIKHTHRLDWLHQVFPWLCQTHPSPWLTSAGFSMTIKRTHRLDWLQQVVPWLCQAHTSSTDFSRFFHDYIKYTHPFDWLQQVFPWLYQTHPSPRLTSPGVSMTISNTPIVLTDFSRFFHDYVKHTPLRRTSTGFSMTMSSTHLFNWLQQVFPWLYQIHSPLRLTSAGFFMTISNTPIASTDFSRLFRCVLDIGMGKPDEVSRGDGYVWYSHGKTCWSRSRRWVCLI